MLKVFHPTGSRGANIKGSERGNLLFGNVCGFETFYKEQKEKTNSLGFLKSIIWVTHPFEYCENDVFAQSLGNRS